jgi:uncharacterized Zn finger protein
MKFPINIGTYKQFEFFMQDIKLIYCKKCSYETFHIIRGFKDYNQRPECMKCGMVAE